MVSPILAHLDLLDQQREAIFAELAGKAEPVLWYRPGPKVWSIGEHLDHTRVINLFTRRLLLVYYPLAAALAWCFRRRPFVAEIDNVYVRPNLPMNVGWIWPPKYTPRRPCNLAFLHDALAVEHAAFRHFYTRHDERLLGHVVLWDPVIGALNLVQWLRVQAWHDAHHFERIRVRLRDPAYARPAAAVTPGQPHSPLGSG